MLNAGDCKWAVIMGDFNSSNLDGKIGNEWQYDDTSFPDYTNLSEACAANGFVMANGGNLGWMATTKYYLAMPYARALDNIICSNNVRIENVIADTELTKYLGSDHIPLVADITLLDG